MIEISVLLSATAAALGALLIIGRQQALQDEPAPQPVPVHDDAALRVVGSNGAKPGS